MAEKSERGLRRRKKDEVITSELPIVSLDAGTIDLNPSTTSIKVVTEATAIVPQTDSILDISSSNQAGYTRRDSLRGDAFDQPEPAAMLTADRLIDVSPKNRPAPESGMRRFLYFLSLKTINLGDNLRTRERKATDARIATQL